jgi:phosphopantothenoylcysteine decarboxylase/phosphopantothenate--cysteine ligase
MARVLLAVSGGIAAYKAPELVRELRRRGHEVRVMVTHGATNFVQIPALAAVSGQVVHSELFRPEGEVEIGHIELADWAEIVVVAPATAHVMARARYGLADDLVTTVLLATRAPIVWVPAMNPNMWQHAATQENFNALLARGHRAIGPDRGELACGWTGEGRMSDPIVIADRLGEMLRSAGDAWAGKRVLISAGPTRVYLDPVRFLTNASTGQMGFELARALREAGADVTLISGPVERSTPHGVQRVDVETADQMFASMCACLDEHAVDAVLMVAAVADLRIVGAASGKLEKDELIAGVEKIRWEKERDLLREMCSRYRPATRFMGFAAQTVEAIDDSGEIDRQLKAMGLAKLQRKGCDAIFVNRVGVPHTGFSTPTNAGHLLFAGGRCVSWHAVQPKNELAKNIIEELGDAWWGNGAS